MIIGTKPFIRRLLLAGFVGGAVRGITGYMKSWSGIGFNYWYFFGMTGLSGLVGLATAYAAHGAGIQILPGIVTPAVALIVGYAGGDFLESVYKIFFVKDPKL